jgi:2-methylisocitrate lyase-like PEP mutase family enzyme
MSDVRKKLRSLVEKDGLVPLIGAYDVLSAKIAEQMGIELLHVGGYNLSAAHLGLPDVGYLTMMENVEVLRRIAANVDIPVIADGDDGYGNYLNVRRMIVEMERAGLAGMHMEDQVLPKRCGHMAGKRVIPKEQMVQKLKAALDVRKDEDFIIIARTDALQVNGFEDALERAQAYREAGADVIFVEAVLNDEQAAAVPKAIDGPCLYNWVYRGVSPQYMFQEVADLGYKFVLYTDALFAVAAALTEFYDELKNTGGYGKAAERMMPFEAFNRLVGIDDVIDLDRRYGGPVPGAEAAE